MGLRVVFILVGLLLPVFALELALRVLGPVFPGNYSTGYYLAVHPAYGRFHVPGYTGWTKAPEYTTYFRTNSLGLRGPEVSPDKRADVYRVLVLGDSFVEAAQVAEEYSFVQRLERSLNAKAPPKRVEVLNAGIGGWGTGQQMLYLQQEGPRLQPDLVLLVFYPGNDVANNSAILERQQRLEEPFKPYWELDGAEGLRQAPHRQKDAAWFEDVLWLGRRSSAAFNFVESGFFDKFRYRDLDLVGGQGDVGKPVLMADYPPEWEQSWQVTERLLGSAARTSEAAGSRFVVVVAPSTFQVVPEDWRDLVRSGRGRASDWDQDKPNKRVAEIAARRGLTVIDLLPVLRAARDGGAGPLYFDRDKHWTANGHEVVARALDERLGALGLLPPAS